MNPAQEDPLYRIHQLQAERLGEVALPSLEAGDLLAFGTTGAYGLSEGMTHFLSHPVPPEVWVG